MDFAERHASDDADAAIQHRSTHGGKKAPQYGATLTFLHAGGGWEPDKWDPIEYSKAQESYYLGYYLEGLLAGDLSRGARGSNEYWFCDSYWVPDPLITGQLAAGWEITDPLTVKFQMRKGVMWQDKPGVMKAREINSADVVFSWNRLIQAKKKLGTCYEWMEAVSAPDKYTVVLKLNKFSADWRWRITAASPWSSHPSKENKLRPNP
ncbi:MAG: hypothetical protein ISS66_01635 [Desulfobacteraceae bacterium]|nr:hypothetical protein [Desulfobacteraceae bacterium]